MEIYLDIETLPTERADVIDMLASQIKPPATYKKPESIAQWLTENRESELDSLVRKTALDGAFGRICCFGFAIDDQPADTFVGTETDILAGVSTLLNALNSDRYTTLIIGHNICGFDLRFLLQRYIVNQLPVPFLVRYAANLKPWESDKVFDTMVQWAGVGNRISLDKLCMALGVNSPKGDLDGSKVFDYWKAGRIAEIAEYCKKDVEATRQVFRRMK